MRYSKCHLKEQCNEECYCYPQQLKEFYKRKYLVLFSHPEVSINCNVSLQKLCIICSNCHLKQTLREDCNAHYNFTQCHGCKKLNSHQVESFSTHKRALSGLSACISLHKVYTY